MFYYYVIEGHLQKRKESGRGNEIRNMVVLQAGDGFSMLRIERKGSNSKIIDALLTRGVRKVTYIGRSLEANTGPEVQQ